MLVHFVVRAFSFTDRVSQTSAPASTACLGSIQSGTAVFNREWVDEGYEEEETWSNDHTQQHRAFDDFTEAGQTQQDKAGRDELVEPRR